MGLLTFTLVLDHQVPVSILNNFTLEAVENPKTQRLKELLSSYVFTTVLRKCREHAIPNAVSRSDVSDPAPGLNTFNPEKDWMREPRTL